MTCRTQYFSYGKDELHLYQVCVLKKWQTQIDLWYPLQGVDSPKFCPDGTESKYPHCCLDQTTPICKTEYKFDDGPEITITNHGDWTEIVN